MIVRLVKNWSAPNIMRQTPGGTGEWEGVQFTEEPVRDVDAVIVLNAPHLPIRGRCPPGRKILISQESPIPDYAWHQDSFSHFDQCYTFWPNGSNRAEGDFSPCLPWWVDKSYDQLTRHTKEGALRTKSRGLSWVTTAQTKKPGHKLRMELLEHLQSGGVEFDLFGKGFREVVSKDEGLDDYRYSLAVENFQCDNYWTEKIADCFLSWTIPVYWGAPNIGRFFPEGSFVSLDLTDMAAAARRLRALVDGGYYDQHLSALAEARDLVLNHYQLFPYWAKRLKGEPIGRRVRFSIPANTRFAAAKTSGVSFSPDQLRRSLRGILDRGQDLVSRWEGTVVSGPPSRKAAALTFDDGPDPLTTPAFLDLLDRHGAKGTFFLIGKAAEAHPDLVTEIRRRGHEVANHTWSHPSLNLFGFRRAWEEVQKAGRTIRATGPARWFRPPYGRENRRSWWAARLLGWRSVTWTGAADDWLGHDAQQTEASLREAVRPGAIVLCHDTLWDCQDALAADRGPLIQALDRVLLAHRDRLQFVTVSELLRKGGARRVRRVTNSPNKARR